MNYPPASQGAPASQWPWMNVSGGGLSEEEEEESHHHYNWVTTPTSNNDPHSSSDNNNRGSNSSQEDQQNDLDSTIYADIENVSWKDSNWNGLKYDLPWH